jgi:SAM-dependent methyltransferase
MSLRDNRTGVFSQAFSLEACSHCGLRAIRPAPAEEVLAHAYEHGYGPYAGTPTTVPAAGRWARLETLVRHAWHVVDGAATLDRVPISGRVLDVGAGQGDDVLYLLRRGLDAMGLEPNPAAVDAAQRRGLPVVKGTLDSTDLPPGTYDTIVLNQVFEHLPDPHRSLGRVARLLRPGGRVVLFTPNPEGLPARVFGNEWAHWHAPYHLYLYGPRQLRRVVRSAGFRVETLRTLTPAFWLAMSLHFWRHRSQVDGPPPPRARPQPPLLARLAVAPFGRALDLARAGDCVVAVVVRP